MRTLIFPGLLLAAAAHAQDFRASMLPSAREQAQYIVGTSNQHWVGGQVNWYYNPLNQPSNLSTAAVVNAMQVAAARWSSMCNVTFTYMGTTSATPIVDGGAASVDRINVFGWGLLQGDQAGYGAYTQWWWVGNGLVDADIIINTAFNWTAQNVEAIMTHEVGHALGISHSDVSTSVMFSSPYHSYSYMRTLRGDDADACAALYGASSTVNSNRAFNWAEAVYSQYLSPSLAVSAIFDGYYYRYYPGTNSYVGTRDGNVYYMGSNGVIQNMGTLNSYTTQVHNAGY
ncbi:MAG: M57 family metalloprotease [Pseudomonadota bacterium]